MVGLFCNIIATSAILFVASLLIAVLIFLVSKAIMFMKNNI